MRVIFRLRDQFIPYCQKVACYETSRRASDLDSSAGRKRKNT